MNSLTVKDLAQAESLRHEFDAFIFMVMSHNLQIELVYGVTQRMERFENLFMDDIAQREVRDSFFSDSLICN